MLSRAKSINRIISRYYPNFPPRYLEIGVWNGETLREIDCPAHLKDGVDPAQYGKNVYINYPETSDSFFANNARGKYDIIFIDGLHTAHQVTIDLINSLRFINPGGFIVLDDVYPHCEREQTALDLRRLGEPLTGDVWKAVYHVLDKLEQFCDIYFDPNVERGHLVLRVRDLSKSNIELDKSIPTGNTTGFTPEEWNRYTWNTDFTDYTVRLQEYYDMDRLKLRVN